MQVVVDIGNTQTVIGIYRSPSSEIPDAIWRITTNKSDAADDIFSKIFPLLQSVGIDPFSIDCAAYASVVPALGAAWNHMLKNTIGAQTIQCSAKSAIEANLFETSFCAPFEIGADRVADAIAAKHLFGYPVVVVDFGTATNFEFIDRRGSFVGGIIAPGIMTGANALYANATRLAPSELKDPDSVIGKNTEGALASGIVLGEAARVDGLLSRAFEELGTKSAANGGACHVIATGGLCSLVAEHSREITDVRPDLTLIGLRLLADAML